MNVRSTSACCAVAPLTNSKRSWTIVFVVDQDLDCAGTLGASKLMTPAVKSPLVLSPFNLTFHPRYSDSLVMRKSSRPPSAVFPIRCK